jgi:hypothetical protein
MGATVAPERPVIDPLRVFAEDVTGSKLIELEGIDGHRKVSDVAQSLAGELNLPMNSPWALRDEKSARMLDDDLPLGQQIEQDARLTVIPRSHLG